MQCNAGTPELPRNRFLGVTAPGFASRLAAARILRKVLTVN